MYLCRYSVEIKTWGGSNKVQTIHRTIAPNIRTIHRNSTWLRRKSNYAVPIKHTTLFLFPTNHKFKNPANFSAGSREKILFAKHEPGSNNHPLSCKHLANANVKPMKNTENTMKFPPTKRLRMDIHDLNICYPSCANSFRLTANPPGKPNILQQSSGWFNSIHCRGRLISPTKKQGSSRFQD